MSVLPLAESNLGGCLAFATQQEKERYKDISTRKILTAKYIHYPTLEKLNVKDNFDSLIDKIGLRKFVDVDCLGYVELIREFYATFQFNIPDDFTLHTPDVIKFRTLFLGPYITLLAINLCVLDPDNNDLHPACKKEFLDMSMFERTGVVEFKEGRFHFTEPGTANYSFYICTTFEHSVRENGAQAEQDGAKFGRILRECGIHPTISAKPIDVMWIKAHNSGKFFLSLRFNFYVSFDYLTLGTMDFLGGDLVVSAFADLSFDLPLRWFREKRIHGHLFACAGNVAKLTKNEYRNFSFPKFLESTRSSIGVGIVSPTNLFRLKDLSSFGLISDVWQPLEFESKPINFRVFDKAFEWSNFQKEIILHCELVQGWAKLA
ncbi:hypothetical protein WN944_024175 [Citrus x changshan-huyou]|uniref:Uncharacterized protein n=1 Tax=Citrus x changshan-huyou TaxID=2935761 RepID=A0AAP0QAE9_9ROSI